MAKQLADLGKAGPRPQQLGRKAVAKKVSAVVRTAVNACPIKRLLRNHRDGAAGGKTDMWRKHPQKQPTTCRSWSPVPDIRDDSCANIVAKRHRRLPSSLAMDKDTARLPIDIVKTERRNLDGPQAKLGQDHQNRIVPEPHCRGPIAGIENLLDLLWRQESWQASKPPATY